MQIYDFSSARFINSFPKCADGILGSKYHQLLSQLFPGFGVFMMLLNEEGDIFVDTDPSFYRLDHPSILLHLLTNGSSVLFTNSLRQKPYNGIFCHETEEQVQFFVCCAIKATNGRLIGGFGVIGQQHKTLLPDEKAFLQWMAENLAQDVQVDVDSAPVECPQMDTLPLALLSYLDDLYIISDIAGCIVSVAEQVPVKLKDNISTQGNSLSTIFGESHTAFFNELLSLASATKKKQTNILHLQRESEEFIFSVSCNRFSDGWFLITFHDVTERNRMREMLEARKQLLEGILQANNIGVLLLRSDGKVLHYNDNAVQWLSLDTHADFAQLPKIHWHDEDRAANASSPFQQIFTQKDNVKDQRYACQDAHGVAKVFSLNVTYVTQQRDALAQATFFIQDVSERAALEVEMRALDQQLQFLLQASPVVTYKMTAEPPGKMAYISPNAHSILGVSLQQTSAASFDVQNMVHADDKLSRKTDIMQPFDTVSEYRLWHESLGVYRWFKDIRRFVADDSNAVWIGALLDITERKEAELKQQQIQHKFDMLLQHVPGMLYQYELKPDGSSCFPFVTAGISAIYGVSPEQVLHDASDLFRVVHPDDIQRVNDSIQQSASTLRAWSCRYRINLAGGKTTWLAGEATPTKMPDGSILWHGYIRDRTVQQLIEQKNEGLQLELSSTLDSLVDAVIGIDKQGIIQNLNPATCSMFGYSKTDLLGKNIAMLMPTSVAQHHDGFIHNFLNTGEAKIIGIGREVNALHAEGYEFPIALSISVIGEGENISFVGCCHDLTLLKKQQEQLVHTEKLSAVGKLTSSLAHDFNNILGIIRGYAEMLQQETAQVAKLAQPIVEASDRASAMIAELLDFSSSKKRALSNIQLNQHLLALRPLLEKTLSADITLCLALSEQDISLNVELPAFDNALINMTVNAMHAMKGQAGGQLRITTQLCLPAELPQELILKKEAYAIIGISDNGCGMADSVLNKIFEPFFTTKNHEGTGLGLAQAYGMVQRCHGKIMVSSSVGKGSCFRIYLPQALSMPFAINKTQKTNDAVVKATTTSNLIYKNANADSTVILLVDDESELLEMNAMLLESAGYTVLKANKAVDAMLLAEQQHIDLLVSDIVMPGMNGFELAKQLKSNYPHIQVQLMSGFADKSMITDEICNHWYEQRLAKPVVLTTLLKRISEMLRQ